ncbi:SHOCT domain-containing protein [Streptomyces sp. NPDC014846]|uniref:SHOCT domain-containing protein n=1 Tax=unclassified Streptomyces TaxID=2593676 RepID=UPI0036FCEE8B
MTRARRRARLALTLLGLIIAAIGLVIYLPASSDSVTADQEAIDASSADWADTLGYEADQSARDARFEAEQDKRIAEEDKTFGMALIGIGAVVFSARWAVRPEAGATVKAAPPMPVFAPAAPPSPADEIAKLAALRDQGVLTDAEFEQRKQRLLST